MICRSISHQLGKCGFLSSLVRLMHPMRETSGDRRIFLGLYRNLLADDGSHGKIGV